MHRVGAFAVEQLAAGDEIVVREVHAPDGGPNLFDRGGDDCALIDVRRTRNS